MGGDEQDLLRKINGLLKKAEGTDNENEAAAFFAKAHELMVRYAIDEERVRQTNAAGNRPVEEPHREDYMFSSYAHHGQAKEDLLAVIAKSQSVRSHPYSNRKDSNLWREGNRGLRESKWTMLIGYESDIAHAKMLFLSLLIQSQKFATEDWRRTYGERKHSNEGLGKFTWISGHMEGFAERIGERFREVNEVVYAEQADASSLMVDKEVNIQEWMYTTGLAVRPRPVVERCYERGFPPHVKTRKNSIPWWCMLVKGHDTSDEPTPHSFTGQSAKRSYSQGGYGRTRSYEGMEAGRSAGNRADLGQPRATNPSLKG